MEVIERDELYKQLTDNLGTVKLSISKLSKPDLTVEAEIANIFTQARQHRNRLVNFYILYTIGFTLFVFGIIFWQAKTRLYLRNTQFELIPQWALNLLVTGMFGQFVGLLTIVTHRVWDFKPFFAHYRHMLTSDPLNTKETGEKE